MKTHSKVRNIMCGAHIACYMTMQAPVTHTNNPTLELALIQWFIMTTYFMLYASFELEMVEFLCAQWLQNEAKNAKMIPAQRLQNKWRDPWSCGGRGVSHSSCGIQLKPEALGLTPSGTTFISFLLQFQWSLDSNGPTCLWIDNLYQSSDNGESSLSRTALAVILLMTLHNPV